MQVKWSSFDKFFEMGTVDIAGKSQFRYRKSEKKRP
jgi:hypothetical protein